MADDVIRRTASAMYAKAVSELARLDPVPAYPPPPVDRSASAVSRFNIAAAAHNQAFRILTEMSNTVEMFAIFSGGCPADTTPWRHRLSLVDARVRDLEVYHQRRFLRTNPFLEAPQRPTWLLMFGAQESIGVVVWREVLLRSRLFWTAARAACEHAEQETRRIAIEAEKHRLEAHGPRVVSNRGIKRKLPPRDRW